MGFSDFKDKSGGRAAVSNKKSDMNLVQIGGEGGGKDGKIPSGNKDIAFHPVLNTGSDVTPYSGSGRDLDIESF